MVELAFVTSGEDDLVWPEVLAAVRDELTAAGIRSSQTVCELPEPRHERVYVATPATAALLGDEPAVAERTIVVCAGHPRDGDLDSTVKVCARAGATFAISVELARELRRRGIAASELPLGYTERWDRFRNGEEQADAQRDIDVLFIGLHTARRARYLAAYNRVLLRRTVQLQLSEGSAATWLSPEAKRSLLTRARIVINLHRSEGQGFEWLRALDAIHSGCVLLSEHSTDFAPLEPGRHLFTGTAESLGLLADHLLDEPHRLPVAARGAYELIQQRRPMRAAARSLAEAASTLVDRALPAGPPRPAPVAPPAPVRPFGAPSSVAGQVDTTVQRELKDLKLDVIELRRMLSALNLALQAPDHRPPPRVRNVARTSAGAESPSARVTVVVPVYNHAAEVAEALESVVLGTYRDFELVVVDDGSSDGSGDVVRAWMRSHDHVAATLVEHPVNRGLGAARNTAIEFAHGEYCLMLDADNALYPRCLEALTARLDADPQLAFAYPILELFGDLDWLQHGGWQLTNWFPWTPEQLRIYNYIDALALIRTSVLRELGGYTVERRLHGLEDYDLWCRIADLGLRGALVAQILARYRVAQSSMVALSELSLSDARAALAERSPKLFALSG